MYKNTPNTHPHINNNNKKKTATTTSSSSQPESSRLDSVSSTPESTPENLKSSLNIMDTTTAPVSPARAKQTAAVATTTTTNNGKTTSTASLDEISRDTNKKLDEVENNVNANTTTTPVKSETPIKAIDNKLEEEVEVATREEIKPIELMNGNAIKTTSISKTTTSNGNLDNTDGAATSTTTTTTIEATNGNEVITEDHKKSLGGKNIYPTLDTKNNDSRIVNGSSSLLSLIDNKKNSQSNDNLDNITKIRKLESKNPFEEDERIYEVPVGE